MKKYLGLLGIMFASSIAFGVYVEPPYPITIGGTGQVTQQSALNAIAGAVTNRDFIRCDGTNCSVAAIQVADVPTLNQNTTGSAASLSATLGVPTGGTGDTTFTANLPLLGNGTSPLSQGTVTGNTTKFATSTGALTSGHCVDIDASGNFVDAGASCASGSGTPGGSNTQLQYNNSGSFGGISTLTFDGTNLVDSGATTLSGVLNISGAASITGPSISITSATTVSGYLTSSGGSSLTGGVQADTLNVSGTSILSATTLSGAGQINTAGTISGASLAISGSSTISGTTLSGTGQLATAGTITASAMALSGAATVNGATSITGALSVGGAFGPMTTGGDLIYSGASGVANRLANGTSGQILSSQGGTSAPQWVSTPAIGVYTSPTVQKFLTGSGTYTTPANVEYITVELVGGGGGGGGGGTGSQGSGGTGGDTSFGTSLLVGHGGVGAVSHTGGAGGTASLGSGPIGLDIQGGSGTGGSDAGAISLSTAGGSGASSPFGGGGGGADVTNNGYDAISNTGSGGGGGSATSVTTSENGGGGGGSGGYVYAIISSPSSTYPYAVGAAGTAGSAGTSGTAGGAGGSGVLLVTEHYAAGGNISSNVVGQEHLEAARLGTNCAILSQSGSWLTLSSGTAPASGCVYTITAGEFSAAPSCSMSGVDDNVCIAHGSSATTSTQVAVWTYTCTTTTPVSTAVDIICMGPH